MAEIGGGVGSGDMDCELREPFSFQEQAIILGLWPSSGFPRSFGRSSVVAITSSMCLLDGGHIVEGYNWRLIIRCAGSAFLTTFILTVLWCLRKKDVQGGTGIGQYSIAAIALALAMFASEKI